MSLDPFYQRPIRVLLAPMEGVVDAVMRKELTALGGIDLCVSEFIRVTDRLLPRSEFIKYCPELLQDCKTASGVPVAIQLLGGQAGPVAENAAFACTLGAPGIDLNFGCPAPTVNRHDGGASLLKNPHRVFDVTRAVREAVPLDKPVTAKVRLGFSDKSQFLEIAHAAEEAGAHWLVVHARTRDEGYKPPAHWEFIARIREALKIKVIANGDIWTVADSVCCREVTGCDSLMLGRGLIANPSLALQTQALVFSGDDRVAAPAPIMPWSEAREHLWKFTLASARFRTPLYGICRSKQWCKFLARTYPEAAVFFETLKRVLTWAELEAQFGLSSVAPEVALASDELT
jgi:tRNA-dihydrouridine synthase C